MNRTASALADFIERARRSAARLLRSALVLAALAIAAAPPLGADVVINEILAANSSSIADEDGDLSDWIEFYNDGPAAVSLFEWSLTDDPALIGKWQFPDIAIPAGGYLIVFASGKNRNAPGLELHTNFSIDAGGEFIALAQPDGTIAQAFSPALPRQRDDISYGVSTELAPVVTQDSRIDWHVPTSAALGDTWKLPSYAPTAAWGRNAEQALGYHSGEGGAVRPPLSFWALDGDTLDGAGVNDASYEGGVAPTFVTGHDGRAGGALRLNGTSEYAQVNTLDALPVFNAPAYTVAMWVKGSPQGDKRVYSEGSSSNNNVLFTIGTDNAGSTGAVDIFLRTDGGATVINHIKSVGTAFDNTWHHIAWVDEGGTAALYIDGVLDGRDFSYAKPALPLDIVSLGAVLRSTACCFFTGDIDDAAVWDEALTPAEIAALAAGAGPGGGSLLSSHIRTDVKTTLQGANSGVYVRAPFTVADPAASGAMTMRIRYDDGFVALVNGVEVARRNAPAGALAWNAAATAERADTEAVVYESIPLPAALDALQAGANVLAIHALNRSAADGDFLLGVELEGATTLAGSFRYFSTPTPGAANSGGFVDFVADTSFSVDRGFFDAPFSVEITSATPGATIRYTTNTTEPTETNGTIYTGPIAIDGTTLLRARAFKAGLAPTNVDTHSYIFLDEVIRQPAAPAGFPSLWHRTWAADYEMDPMICIDTRSAYYEPTIKDDLLDIPTMSIVTPNAGLFDATTGIYPNSEQRGLAWERAASMEYIDPRDPDDSIQVNCGLRMQGGASRFPERQLKHSFRLLFKGIYGPTKLEARLFPDTTVERFDTIILRCFFTDGWATRTVEPRYRPADSQYIRDVWMKDSQIDQGQPSGHNTYVHLYINGLYWGLYNPTERMDSTYHAEHFGGDKDDFDVIKDSEALDGTKTIWNQMMAVAGAGLATNSAYQAIQGRNPDGVPNPSLTNYVNVDSLIDYMILHIFAGAEDWPHHNWMAGRRRVGASEGFWFYSWDQEIVLDDLNRNRINVSDADSPAYLYSRFRDNAEFRVRFGDRVHKHLFNGGALTVEECIRRFERRTSELDRAIVGESARWGDIRREPPYTRDVEWVAEQGVLYDDYFPQIHTLSLSRFRSGNLYPNLAAPSFNRHGGRIEPGFVLDMTAASGSIYYTLDGSDPRLVGGGLAPGARLAGSASLTPILGSGVPARALVPTGPALGLDWTALGFDDSSWTAGTTGVGYERTTGFEDLIGIDVRASMDGVNASVYLRVPFTVDDPAAFDVLTLKMKYDDGFVAYLNGVRVAGANDPSPTAWNSGATAPVTDLDAVVFQNFDITAHRGALRAGANVLAVHGLNFGAGSTDMVVLPELEGGVSDGSGVTLLDTTVVNARTLSGNEWSALTEAAFVIDTPLRITEVHYHPGDPPLGSPFSDDDFEFLELQNVGDAPIDLRGITLEGAVRFDFSTSLRPLTLAPGALAVLVENTAAFATRYDLASIPVFGRYEGRLNNSGERLTLLDADGYAILDFEISDRWEPETDGLGRSLVIRDPAGDPDAWGEAASWRASIDVHGSPGVDESSGPPPPNRRVPGDINSDGELNISDGVRLLVTLFVDPAQPLPCDGALDSESNVTLLDANGDAGVDLSDAVRVLNYLFTGGPPHVLGTACVSVPGCAALCGR